MEKPIIISTNGLYRQYQVGNTVINAVKNVSLTVKQGELTVLRGRSGSGKTTLLNLLSTLDMPTQGNICLLYTYPSPRDTERSR